MLISISSSSGQLAQRSTILYDVPEYAQHLKYNAVIICKGFQLEDIIDIKEMVITY